LTNHAESVRARLRARARADGEDFQRVLVRYANERLLYRLGRSTSSQDFVLKGATLFTLWLGEPHRATKDLDLLGRGEPDVEHFVGLFRGVLGLSFPEDGITFDPDALEGRFIREDARYQGVRLIVPATLAGARLRLQVDIGLGDAVVPAPVVIEFPTLLPLPGPQVKAYARETVVAEKLEALVILGMTNSRMKDYYDLDLLRDRFEFDDVLVDAVAASFRRRGTPIPSRPPVGLTDAFAQDAAKRTQWSAFLRKAGASRVRDLADVVGGLRGWLWPVLEAASRR